MHSDRDIYIRGYTIPEYEKGAGIDGFRSILTITNEEEILSNFLTQIKELINGVFKEGITNESQLKQFNDFYILLVYRSLSNTWENVVESWLDSNLKRDAEFNELFEKSQKEIQTYFKTFPADFRPGLNTSSLLIHSLSTSVFATCLYMNAKESLLDLNNPSLELEVLRTASLFHEIARPISQKDFYSKSKEVFNEFFGSYFSEDILSSILKIMDHSSEGDSELVAYLKKGIEVASIGTNLKNKVIKILSDELPDIGADNNFDDMTYWEKNKNKIESLTKIFLEQYDKAQFQQPLDKIEFLKEGEFAIIRGDVRHIHDYIDHVNSFAELRQSSSILDYALSTQLVLDLLYNDSMRILPEHIIYSSGGNIVLFSPGKNKNSLVNYLERRFPQLTMDGLVLHADGIFFDSLIQDSFGELYSKLAVKVGMRKNKIEFPSENSFYFGSCKLCESCKERPAQELISKGSGDTQEELYYCKSCKFKYDLKGGVLGEKIQSFLMKNYWNNVLGQKYPQELQHREWNDINNVIMEFIAGVPLEDIDTKKDFSDQLDAQPFDPYRLAVINADGDLIGEFIAKSITLSDLFVRIIHTSNTMIQILEDLHMKMDKYLPGYDLIQDHIRLDLGKIYIGGDDILILAPGYLSIPIILTITKEFYKRMGKKTKLSTGVFLCPPKYPIWTAIKAARELLDKNAKKVGRTKAFEEDKVKMGAIDFQTFLGGTDVSSQNNSRPLSNRAYKILRDRSLINQKHFHYILNVLLGSKYEMEPELEYHYANAYNFVYKELSKEYKAKNNSILNNLRNKVKRIQTFYSLDHFNQKAAISYTLYQIVRQKDRPLDQESYLKLFELLGTPGTLETPGTPGNPRTPGNPGTPGNPENTHKVPLSDCIELIRFLSGGRL